MEPEGIIYDEDGDIFHNNKYLDILKVKDYVLDITDLDAKIDINVVFKKKDKTFKLDTWEKKGDYVENTKIKNSLMGKLNSKLMVNRYLKPINAPPREISANYIVQQYSDQQLNNKNIFVMSMLSEFIPSKYIYFEEDNTIFSTFSSYLYNNSNNNNIYCWIKRSNNKKYKENIKNIKNNYYLLNNNNNGDILIENEFEILIDKIKDTKMDFIYIDFKPLYDEYNMEIQNKYLIILLQILPMICMKNTQILFNCKIDDNMINNCINILKYSFNNVKIIHPKYLHITTKDKFILFDKFNGNTNYNVDKIISNKLFFDINYYIESLNVVSDNKIILDFLNNLSKERYSQLSRYSKLIKYLYDEKYKQLGDIILSNLKIRQYAFANNQKHLKYLQF
jgi:hypothetical protein